MSAKEKRQRYFQKSKSQIVSAVRARKENKSSNANKNSNLAKINEDGGSAHSPSEDSDSESDDDDLNDILDDDELAKSKTENKKRPKKVKTGHKERKLNVDPSPLLNL